MSETTADTLYAWATVELTDLNPGDPPVTPVVGPDGRSVLRIFRRGEVIPLELFADYIPSPGMVSVNSDIDSLLEHGAVGWTEPGPQPVPDEEWYEIRLPDGTVTRHIGPPPPADNVLLAAGDTAATTMETATGEDG